MSHNFWGLLFVVMCLGGPARAHPHVFVDARTGFIFGTDGQLEALRIAWTYDEFTTLILFESLNLDQDGDGQFNDADRAAVIDGETNWDPEYKGDVYLEVGGQDYPLGRPEAAAVTLENNQVEVSFDLPLSQPVRIEGAPAFLRLYDPVFFYAYTAHIRCGGLKPLEFTAKPATYARSNCCSATPRSTAPCVILALSLKTP